MARFGGVCAAAALPSDAKPGASRHGAGAGAAEAEAQPGPTLNHSGEFLRYQQIMYLDSP